MSHVYYIRKKISAKKKIKTGNIETVTFFYVKPLLHIFLIGDFKLRNSE